MSSDLKQIHARIQQRLSVVGITASAASKASGKRDAIRNLQRAIKEMEKNPQTKREGISTATLKALAPVLHTTPEWLFSAAGPEEPDAATGSSAVGPFGAASAKVVGIVQAGVWTEFESFEDEADDGVEVPLHPGRWAHLPQMSYAVRGKSMDKARIFDGDYVVCVPYMDARPDITDGDIAVVERVRNSAVERSVKQIEIHGKEVHFCPRSSDDRFKPIVINVGRRMAEADDTEIRIVGLVIGTWRPV